MFDQFTTGASNDLEQATNIARQMITRFGMSKKLGPRTFGKREEMVFLGREISEQRDYSDNVAEQIDDEVRSLIENAYGTAMRILKENKAKLDHISNYLIENETIEEEDVPSIFDDQPPPPQNMPAPASAD